MASLAPTPTTRAVVPWIDPVVDQLGHDPRSAYVERFWLGILGPTGTWLLRRLAARLQAEPDGFVLDLASTALELGLGSGVGPSSPFARTLARCERFGAIALPDERTMRVRRHLPPLTSRQLQRLPEHLQVAHERAVGATARGSGRPDERVEAARGMALALIGRGLAADLAERELHGRGVHPAVAFAAVRWAAERQGVAAVDHGTLPPAA